MLVRDALGWFACWRECPPVAESLALIAVSLGAWKPPEVRQRKPSSEQELLAFAMFAHATMGK